MLNHEKLYNNFFFEINETLFKTFSSYKNEMKKLLEKWLGNLFLINYQL